MSFLWLSVSSTIFLEFFFFFFALLVVVFAMINEFVFEFYNNTHAFLNHVYYSSYYYLLPLNLSSISLSRTLPMLILAILNFAFILCFFFFHSYAYMRIKCVRNKINSFLWQEKEILNWNFGSAFSHERCCWVCVRILRLKVD